MHWTKIKKQLKEQYEFQDIDQSHLTQTLFIPWSSRKYIYSCSNSFDQPVAICKVYVNPSTITVRLFDQPYMATYNFYYNDTNLSIMDKNNEYSREWSILMEAYEKDYNKSYPLSLKNVKLVLNSIIKLSEEMPHCFEEIEIS